MSISCIAAGSFPKRIESVWDGRIAPFCKTLRAVGLLANDLSFAAAPLRREVDPVRAHHDCPGRAHCFVNRKSGAPRLVTTAPNSIYRVRRGTTTQVDDKFECIGQERSAWCKKAELSDRADSETPRRLPHADYVLHLVWMFTRGRSATA